MPALGMFGEKVEERGDFSLKCFPFSFRAFRDLKKARYHAHGPDDSPCLYRQPLNCYRRRTEHGRTPE